MVWVGNQGGSSGYRNDVKEMLKEEMLTKSGNCTVEVGCAKAAREIIFGCEPISFRQYKEEEEKAEDREEKKHRVRSQESFRNERILNNVRYCRDIKEVDSCGKLLDSPPGSYRCHWRQCVCGGGR